MAHIGDLPAELLGRIFSKLKPDELLKTVPLVSQTWSQVVASPQLWPHVVVDLRHKDGGFGPHVERFFTARAAGIETLALRLPEGDCGFVCGVLECLRGRAQLRRLCLDFHATAEQGQDQAATALSLLDSQLEVLCLHGLVTEHWEQGLSRVSFLATSLRVLHLHYDSSWKGEAENMTSELPGELLGLATCLEELMVSGKGGSLLGDRLPPSVGRLTRLTSLSFILAGGGRVPEQWQALTRLRVLRVVTLIGSELHLPDLSMLTRLAVVDLGCRNVPAGLAALPSLTHLTLRGLWAGQQQDAGAEQDPAGLEALETLLGDSRLALESLCLRNCNLHELPDAVTQRTTLCSLAITNTHVWRLPTDPPRTRFLENLRHLDLRANCFSHVPLQAVAAPQLQTLALVAGEPAWDIAAARRGSVAHFAPEQAEVQARLEKWWTEGVEEGELDLFQGGALRCSNKVFDSVWTPDLVGEWVMALGTAASSNDIERPEPLATGLFLPLVHKVSREELAPARY